MPSIQVAYKRLKRPLPPECSLDANGSLNSLAQVVHETLSLALRAEPLLDSDDYLCILAIELHELLPPASSEHPFEDVFVDHCAGSFSSLRILSAQFAANVFLDPCRLQVSVPVKSRFDRIPCFVFDEQLGHATFPSLVFANGQYRCDLWLIMVDLSSFVKDALHEALVDTVHDSLADDRPELITEIIITNTIAIANFSNLDCRKHATGPELVIYGLVVVVICIS